MSLFQKSVVNRYIEYLDKEVLHSKWVLYKSYFHDANTQENIKAIKEEAFQEGFIRELFVNILGYKLNPTPDYNFVLEKKNVEDSRKADGAIIIENKVKAVIELKDTKITDLAKVKDQAFSYKVNQTDSCVYVITSNFEKLRFYIDNAIDYEEFPLFTLTEEQFNLLYLCLSIESISKDIPKKVKNESLSQEDIITQKLYKDYSLFKRDLYQNLVHLNPNFEPLVLFKKSQKLLDRFLFLFFGEDRHLLPPNSVRLILSDWNDLIERDVEVLLYDRFKTYFNYLNEGYKGKRYNIFAYNGGLFQPDEILDSIIIDDDLLYKHTIKIAEYDFGSEVDVNILGHIFENSLNELDEIKAQLEGQEIDKSKTKRKKDGVFYTPKYITQYIVENTVGKLCKEKKEALGIFEEEYYTDKKRQKKTKHSLDEKLTNYKNWLLQLTICDPACGSGAFLNQALDFLIKEHQYVDELKAKLFGNTLVLSDSGKSILENNLFGVDLNEESVEIAKLSLWLRTAQPNRKLNDLSGNIKCGNSLIDDQTIVGDKAFNWQKEFPKVFEDGGFDVVIGNPPYFNIQTLGVGSKEAQHIQAKYAEIWQDKSDILFYFFYKAIEISKSEIGFIVSNAFLFSDKAQKLRNYILDDNRISKIINFDKYMVFSDASITSCITIFNKKPCITKAIVLKEKQYSITEVSEYINNSRLEFEVVLEKNKVFALVDDKIGRINKKIDSNHKQLKDVCHIGKGMETAANSVFSFDEYPIQFDSEFIKKRMVGENIDRYMLNFSSNYILYFEHIEIFEHLPVSIQNHLNNNIDLLAERATVKNEGRLWWRYSRPMHKENYHLDKIWCSYRGTKNKFMIDQSSDYIGLTNTTVIFDTNKNLKLPYILTLLNSKLLNFRYKSIGKQTGGGVFEYFANGVGKLPIPLILIQEQQPFIEKANIMLSINKELQEYSLKFRRTIQRKFELEELPKKLQDWYKLSYAEFIKELTKKKVILSLSQEAEWEDYFMQESKKALELKAIIDATDKAIDTMVYKLYELTDEEIQIVDNI